MNKTVKDLLVESGYKVRSIPIKKSLTEGKDKPIIDPEFTKRMKQTNKTLKTKLKRYTKPLRTKIKSVVKKVKNIVNPDRMTKVIKVIKKVK